MILNYHRYSRALSNSTAAASAPYPLLATLACAAVLAFSASSVQAQAKLTASIGSGSWEYAWEYDDYLSPINQTASYSYNYPPTVYNSGLSESLSYQATVFSNNNVGFSATLSLSAPNPSAAAYATSGQSVILGITPSWMYQTVRYQIAYSSSAQDEGENDVVLGWDNGNGYSFFANVPWQVSNSSGTSTGILYFNSYDLGDSSIALAVFNHATGAYPATDAYASISVQATFQLLDSQVPAGPGGQLGKIPPGGPQPTSGDAIWAQPLSGNWSDQSNWIQGVLPASGIDTWFDTGSSTPYTVTLTGASAALSLTLQGDNVTLAMGGNTLAVGGVLTVDGFGGQVGYLTVVGPGSVAAGGGLIVTSVGNLTLNSTTLSTSSVVNDGFITINSGSTFTTTGNEIHGNSAFGQVIQNGGTHTVTGTLTIAANSGSSGAYTLQGGSLTAGALNINSGGTFNLQGAAPSTTLYASVINNYGTLSVANNSFVGSGSVPGQTQIFTQNAGATLSVQLNGTGSGQFGQIIAAAANLAGNLNVTLASPYTPTNLPAYADSYQVISAGSASGTFSNAPTVAPATFASGTNNAGTNSAGLFNVSYNSTGGTGGVTLSGFHQVDYLGIGVNWTGVTPPGAASMPTGPLLGNLNVANMKNALFVQTAVTPALPASASYSDNYSQIDQAFKQLGGVGANDIIVIELSSHAGLLADGSTPAFAISGATGTNYITATQIHDFINNDLPHSAAKIVILDCCHADAFLPALDGLQNVAVLAATSDPSRQSWYLNDGTSFFSDAIEAELQKGIYNLAQIEGDVKFYNDMDPNGLLEESGSGGNLIGQTLFLEDSGSSVFDGMAPSLFESSDFNSDLVGASVAAPEPASVYLLLLGSVPLVMRRRKTASVAD